MYAVGGRVPLACANASILATSLVSSEYCLRTSSRLSSPVLPVAIISALSSHFPTVICSGVGALNIWAYREATDLFISMPCSVSISCTDRIGFSFCTSAEMKTSAIFPTRNRLSPPASSVLCGKSDLGRCLMNLSFCVTASKAQRLDRYMHVRSLGILVKSGDPGKRFDVQHALHHT